MWGKTPIQKWYMRSEGQNAHVRQKAYVGQKAHLNCAIIGGVHRVRSPLNPLLKNTAVCLCVCVPVCLSVSVCMYVSVFNILVHAGLEHFPVLNPLHSLFTASEHKPLSTDMIHHIGLPDIHFTLVSALL